MLSVLAGRSGYCVTGALLCVSDIAEDVRERAEIGRRTAHDSLTVCLNRAGIHDALTEMIAAGTCATGGWGVAVVFIDFDRFEEINGTYRRAVSDRLLVSVAQRLRRNRRGAAVGPLGGDKFVVVASGVPSAEQTERLSLRLSGAARRPLNFAGEPMRPGASVG